MFLSILPFWGLVAVLAVLFLVKHFAVAAIEKTQYYLSRVQGQHWMGALNTVAGLNALCTAAILFLPVGLMWALTLAFCDLAVHWLVGYWKIKHKLPTVSSGNVATAFSWLSLIHGSTYLSIITAVVKFLMPQHS